MVATNSGTNATESSRRAHFTFQLFYYANLFIWFVRLRDWKDLDSPSLRWLIALNVGVAFGAVIWPERRFARGLVALATLAIGQMPELAAIAVLLAFTRDGQRPSFRKLRIGANSLLAAQMILLAFYGIDGAWNAATSHASHDTLLFLLIEATSCLFLLKLEWAPASAFLILLSQIGLDRTDFRPLDARLILVMIFLLSSVWQSAPTPHVPKKKTYWRFASTFAALWLVLNAILPQIYNQNERSVFPFVIWRLFSKRYTVYYFPAEIQCTGREHDPLKPIESRNGLRFEVQSMYRMQTIGRLFTAGRADEARLGFQSLLKSYSGTGHCKAAVFQLPLPSQDFDAAPTGAPVKLEGSDVGY